MKEAIEETFEGEEEFAELGQLKESAPPNVLPRLQKRVRTAQLGKDLIERQAMGFWAVIDAFLRLIFVPRTETDNKSNSGEK